MIIRKLERKDIIPASKIVGINYSKKYELLSRKELTAMFRNYAYPPEYIVAEEDGKIIGLAGYIPSWMDYHVYNIFWVNVEPEHQGNGIGTMLIEHIITRIRKIKGHMVAHMILLTTTRPKFYKRFGFKILSELGKSSPKEYLMSMELLASIVEIPENNIPKLQEIREDLF
jgi:N-acetylglutamate synthase-like GNAT family acetyltransferase